ncbi:MAG: RHS repeat-associated core domain-containing protein [Pyrinomonadaceae bacterium]
MTRSVLTDGKALGTDAAIPAIRTFQLDPNGLGAIAESVNLFRGDVTLPLTLISLTGRSGLEAGATLVYKSNVQQEVDTWNMDAPTGPLGLGWSMGYEMIARDNRATAATNNDQYYLIANGGANRLHLTSANTDFWEFQLEQYEFWQIRYYRRQERWEIVKEDGNRYLYGGEIDDITKSPVQYGVKWGGAQGNWIGNSANTKGGQAPYAVAWNISQIRTPWDDGFDFEYDNDVASVGLPAGLRYTLSSRLVTVREKDGRWLRYNYQPKEHNHQIREYQIPHHDPTAPDLIAHQDRYEKQYLSTIELRSAPGTDAPEGALIMRLLFSYAFSNMALRFQGNPDFVKRYLTSVTIFTPEGLALPKLSFSYYNNPESDLNSQTHRGAIKSILYPQGGRVSYQYKETQLSGTGRSTSLQTRGISRVWFGPDYTVVIHYDGLLRGLDVKILSWNGLWVEAPKTYQLRESIDLKTLNVSAQGEFFALSFTTDEANRRLFVVLFHKEKGRFGQWHMQDDFARIPVGPDGQGLVATGERFMVAAASGGAFLARAWNPSSRKWVDLSSIVRLRPGDRYALEATADYFAVASWQPSNRNCDLQLYYFDPARITFTEARLDEKTLFGVDWQDWTPDTFWSLGPDYAVMTYIIGSTETKINYAVKIQQWSAEFVARLVVNKSYWVDSDTKLPYGQSVASGSVVGNVGNLFRFDGARWAEMELPVEADETAEPMLIYGADAAIVSSSKGNALALFNPFKMSWQLVHERRGAQSGIRPTAEGNYLSVNRDLFYRDSTGALRLLMSFDPGINPKSLVNRAPWFIAYEDSSGNTHIFPLENGQIDKAGEIILRNQRIYVDAQGMPGTSLVGPASLLTYRGSFDNPSALTLYQFVNRSVEGQVKSYPVTSLSIDDGYPDSWGGLWESSVGSTAYYYDCANVTVSPDGSVAEYAAATIIFGADPPESTCYPPPDKTAFGRSEFRYHNNRSPRDAGLVLSDQGIGATANYYYSFINGMLFDRIDYDAEGEPKERTYNLYDVRTEYEPVEQPGTRVQLIGGYVKLIQMETSQYEEAISIAYPLAANATLLAAPEALAAAYERRGIEVSGAALIPARTGARWRLFLNPDRPTFLTVTGKGGRLSASVAVVRAVAYEYSWATGLLVSDRTDQYNDSGKLQIFRREIYYGWQVPEYQLLKTRHIWSPVALSVKFVAGEGEDPPGTPTEFQLTTFRQWFESQGEQITKWAPCRTYTALTEAVYDPSAPVPVKFSDWNNDSPGNQSWRRMGEVLTRAVNGPALETLDVQDTPSCYVMDKSGGYRVAEFMNARSDGCAWVGFERYESLAAWRTGGGQPLESLIVTGDAHTGNRSLGMKPDPAQTLETTLTLKGSTPYILSCWIKTPSSFGGDQGQATWSVMDGDRTLETFVIEGTDGLWAYLHFVINLDGAQADLSTVTLVLRNQKVSPASVLLIDDIMIAPLLGSSEATIFDEFYMTGEATVGLNGETTRSFPDGYQRQAFTSSNTSVDGGAVPYWVRQIEQGESFVFRSDAPNSLLDFQATLRGPFANFVNGDGWKAEWSPHDEQRWQVKDRRLIHVAAGADRIEFTPTSGLDDYGVRATVHLPLDDEGHPRWPTRPIGLSIGTDLTARWTPGQGWAVTLGGTSTVARPSTSEADRFATEWLLLAPKDPVTGQTSVFFFADGQLIFSRLNTPPISGALALFLEDQHISFSSIGTFRSPQLAMTYVDGSAKERQKQTFDGSGIIVAETVYDPIGRPAVGTKMARFTGMPLGYMKDFITGFDPTTGMMTGRVADAYPEDEGYPYVRTEFFRTAQSLANKQGMPGKLFAIMHTTDEGEEANPHIMQFDYGTNVQGQFGGDPWPSNQYFVKKVIDQNGGLELTVTTKTDQMICAMKGPSAPGSDYHKVLYFYDPAGRPVKTMPPEGVKAMLEGAPDADKWATINTYDFLDQTISSTSPDSGTTEYVLDRAGQARFVMDAEGASMNPNRILYTKYDVLGRVLDIGWFRAPWDRAQLTEKALSSPDWPDQTQAHTAVVVNSYDGDGSERTLIGQLHQAANFAENEEGAVIETFTYDVSGNVISTSLRAAAFDGEERTVGYTYDKGNNIVRVDYPSGADLPSVVYRYNRLDQIFMIGTPENESELGTFEYDASGAIVGSTINPTAPKPVSQRASYLPPGWPSMLEGSVAGEGEVFSEKLTYTEGGYDGAAYYDGKIASAANKGKDGDTDDYTYKYAYDSLSQLRFADNSERPEASTGNPVTYDLNGNIRLITNGDEEARYEYAQESDRVERVMSGTTQAEAFTYNANGAVTSSTRRNITDIAYNPVNKQASEIVLGAPGQEPQARILFGYNVDGDRILKSHFGEQGTELSAKLYVRDLDAVSLFEKTRRTGGASDDVQFIYGPGGLVALQTKSKRYSVVRDHLGSVRRVVDETGAVVANFNYTAFGAQISRPGGDQPDIIFYRYTSQELDEETGLYNYKARFYDPLIGRFYSVDPASPVSSPYVYVRNNPIAFIDPNGEEPLTAFLIAVIISAIVGAVAGALTYIFTHKGNFNVGKFLLYAVVGLVAGAAGGAAGYGAGLLATGALAAVGVSTSTSIASGIFVGAVTGAVDGIVSATLNQIGVNLIEQRPPLEGVEQSALMGLGIGALAGGALGRITGASHSPTAKALTKPARVVSGTHGGRAYASLNQAGRYTGRRLGVAAGKTKPGQVLGLSGHSGSNLNFIQFTNASTAPHVLRIDADTILTRLLNANFRGRGIDLSAVCYAGQNGIARKFASGLNVPVRAANITTSTYGGGARYGQTFIKLENILKGGLFRTYYPNKLQTGWIALFGY